MYPRFSRPQLSSELEINGFLGVHVMGFCSLASPLKMYCFTYLNYSLILFA